MLGTIRRFLIAAAAATILTLTLTSAAMAQTSDPVPPSLDGIQSASNAVNVQRAQGDGIQGYEHCPYGHACTYGGWSGGLPMDIMQKCGWTDLGSSRNITSSAKAHGNPFWLYDIDAGQYVGYIPAWTQTNLSAAENNRADYVYVVC